MPLNEVNSKDARIASAYHVGRQWSGNPLQRSDQRKNLFFEQGID